MKNPIGARLSLAQNAVVGTCVGCVDIAKLRAVVGGVIAAVAADLRRRQGANSGFARLYFKPDCSAGIHINHLRNVPREVINTLLSAYWAEISVALI